MNTNQPKSNAGDWLFLVGGTTLIGGFLAYENAGQVANWIGWLQSLGTTPIAPTGGFLALLISNWGLVLLVAAMIFAAYKMRSDGNTTTTTEAGNSIKYKPLKYVNVNLIR